VNSILLELGKKLRKKKETGQKRVLIFHPIVNSILKTNKQWLKN